jgi:FMN-binding domain
MSSERRSNLRGARATLVLGVALLACGLLQSNARGAGGGGKANLTVEEALALVFGDAQVEHGTVYLTDEQRARAEELSGSELASAIAHPYFARKDGHVIGTAWIDTHRVRTLRESVMVVVAPDQRVSRVELLAFGEPEEYAPRARWYAQFTGRKLDDELSTKRAIQGVTGATLTARATTAAVRRALALQRVIDGTPPEPPSGGGGEITP